jgi:hypothetical protein
MRSMFRCGHLGRLDIWCFPARRLSLTTTHPTDIAAQLARSNNILLIGKRFCVSAGDNDNCGSNAHHSSRRTTSCLGWAAIMASHGRQLQQHPQTSTSTQRNMTPGASGRSVDMRSSPVRTSTAIGTSAASCHDIRLPTTHETRSAQSICTGLKIALEETANP